MSDIVKKLRSAIRKGDTFTLRLIEVQEAASEIESLRAKLAAAEKDAERWREFQRNTRFNAYYWPGTMTQGARPLDYEETERLIDAAIAKEKE